MSHPWTVGKVQLNILAKVAWPDAPISVTQKFKMRPSTYRSATRTRTPNLRAIGSKIAPRYLEPNMPGINSIVGVLQLSAGVSGLKPTSA